MRRCEIRSSCSAVTGGARGIEFQLLQVQLTGHGIEKDEGAEFMNQNWWTSDLREDVTAALLGEYREEIRRGRGAPAPADIDRSMDFYVRQLGFRRREVPPLRSG